jgi:hypothetical protein
VEATIGDLARYARACLTPPATKLGEALRRVAEPLVPAGPGAEQSLGWVVRSGGVHEHSGATAGFTACVSVSPSRGRAVALLAAFGGSIGFAAHLKNAASLALADRDPREIEVPQPFPAWRDAAIEIAGLLIAGEFELVHERLAASRREKTTPERLAQSWRAATEDAGATETAPEIRILRHEPTPDGAVIAELEIDFPVRPQRLRVGIRPDGSVGGLALLPVGPGR